MVVYEKISFDAYTNNQYICLKNNIGELYFILVRADKRWHFSSISKDGIRPQSESCESLANFRSV